MYGREPDLNDPFRLVDKRKVDREKIYKAWEDLFHSMMKVIPPANSEGISELATRYQIKAREFEKAEKYLKARGFLYFSTLLLLKRAIYLGELNLIEANRSLLRALEQRATEEELIPIPSRRS